MIIKALKATVVGNFKTKNHHGCLIKKSQNEKGKLISHNVGFRKYFLWTKDEY